MLEKNLKIGGREGGTGRLAKRGGFTLIEMLVVIAIIAILMAAIVAVGSMVRANASRRSTLATLKTLDGLMKDYLVNHPEPTVPSPWPYSLVTNQFGTTTPGSDPINWVTAFKSDPDISKKLDGLQFDTDSGGIPTSPRPVIVDAFGNPIRYVPSTTTKEGYFMSAGPDGKFSQGTTTGLRADEIFSYDAQ